MSQWTHVNAAVRYNFIDILQSNNPIENGVFGMPKNYEDESPAGFREYPGAPVLPMGSEGSMDYLVTKVSGSSLASRNVLFWGDLRDYNDVEEILEYFKKVVDKDKYMVRNGVLEIMVERSDTRVFVYDDADDRRCWVERMKEDK